VAKLKKLQLCDIDPPDKPMREFMDPKKMNELAESMAAEGLKQPIAVVEDGIRYKVVFGDRRYAATNTGDSSAATNTGEEGCAISLGIEGRARGAVGCWLTLAEWKKQKDRWHRVDVKTVRVDGEAIKADTFYMLQDGKFVEARS
jgi:hypothetical protein